ncbi:hypothetical protein [Pseudalkalibacillus caeni]|uniref:Uncharacterized protein n=1 Tax=Exobacillus caeni TaxID=2574798 RepID=A0A5R9F7X5_9BACL|nr:hypothetical protein [Pseudalkalibacillus caeni]TLS37728.1 hypothetical protein FCL54_07855 [Pseudalkalibacillus caeni]
MKKLSNPNKNKYERHGDHFERSTPEVIEIVSNGKKQVVFKRKPINPIRRNEHGKQPRTND